jgi:hypothetical protein
MATPGNNDSVVAAAVTPAELEMATIRTSTAAAPPPPPAKKETDTDPFLVKFDEPYDAENPLDWSSGRKWLVTDVLSATGFNRIMVSTIMAPALTSIAKELHMSDTEAAMSLSIYLLATAFGPLAIGPLSEIYGRQVVLHASGIWFFVWNVVCGFAGTKETLIAARFLAGFGASAIYSLAGGVLGDIWRPEHRGRSLGMYLLIPLLGAAVGRFCQHHPVAYMDHRLNHCCRPNHWWFYGGTHDVAMDVLVHIHLPSCHDRGVVFQLFRNLCSRCASKTRSQDSQGNGQQ